jgi:hypothetical protein
MDTVQLEQRNDYLMPFDEPDNSFEAFDLGLPFLRLEVRPRQRERALRSLESSGGVITSILSVNLRLISSFDGQCTEKLERFSIICL